MSFSAEFTYPITIWSLFWENMISFLGQEQYSWLMWLNKQPKPFDLQLIVSMQS